MKMENIGTQTIESERLLLRRFSYTDDDSMLVNWVSDEASQILYNEPTCSTKQEVKELLDTYISAYDQDDNYRWAIILTETGECIGQIALFAVNSKNNFAEIKYAIGSKFQCHGLATEATKAVLFFGFNKMHLHKLQISHMALNAASKRVIEKCGFRYEGSLRDYFYIDGKYFDRLYYSILKNEYEV